MEIGDFEDLCRRDRMRPLMKIDTSVGTIYIAEGEGAATDEFPCGCYRQKWAVGRGDMDVAKDIFFDRFHDPELPLADRQRARMNATLRDALAWASINRDSGRYDQ